MSHYYRFDPPVITQGDAAICWAAALESWLKCVVRTFGEQRGEWSGPAARAEHIEGATWIREIVSKEDLLKDFADDINANGSLKPGASSIKIVAARVGMDLDAKTGDTLTYDYVMGRLREFGHLYVSYFSAVMRHAVVVYGVSTTDGIAVMDPNPDVKLTHRKIEFFREPIRLKEIITIGWPLKGSS
jgi:hypothetical protein